VRDVVEIGMGKTARRGYHLDDLALVPSRRTRGSADVSIAWQIDAHRFDLPLMVAPSDAVVSPTTAALVDKLGGLAVLNGEGLWSRYDDPEPILAELADGDEPPPQQRFREVYAAPVKPDLLAARIEDMRASGARTAVRLSPQNSLVFANTVIDAGADILVIQGTVISAEHVAVGREPLNLKTFIADLDVPVVVGGCGNYQTALHLMRTGAAGVIVGYGAHSGSTTPRLLGIDVPLATAVADAAAARRDYLDETGGRYVHLIAYGDITSGGDAAKAIACGADAVMLGEPLAAAVEAPGGGRYWDTTVSHPKLPRSQVEQVAYADERAPLSELLVGPTADPSGAANIFGALRRAMAKCGYSSVKEFQKVELALAMRG
jgi:IMP dehydrogenase